MDEGMTVSLPTFQNQFLLHRQPTRHYCRLYITCACACVYKRVCDCYIYNGTWWVAHVTGTDPTMTLSFLHPRGPDRSFHFPHKADILTVHLTDIMM